MIPLQGKNVIHEVHGCDESLRSITNVAYSDDVQKCIVVSVYSDGTLRFLMKAIFNATFGEDR